MYNGNQNTGGSSAYDQQRTRDERWRQERAAQSIQYWDPTIMRNAEAAMQMHMGGNQDPYDVRAKIFSSKTGQIILDTAQAANRKGILGYGDSVNYISNITRAMSQRGFTVGYGNDNGQQATQYARGSGQLTEAAATSMAQNLLGGLYGTDAQGRAYDDPSRLSGFNKEEISAVAASVIARGGVGKMMQITSAPILAEDSFAGEAARATAKTRARKERLAAAVEGTEDAELSKELSDLQSQYKDGMSSSEMGDEIRKARDSGNTKLSKELSRIQKGSDDEINSKVASATTDFNSLKLAAAAENAQHPILQDKLRRLDKKYNVEEDDGSITSKLTKKALQGEINDARNAGDEALATELENNVRDLPSAMRINPDAGKEVRKTTRTMIDGMSVLGDIYTELNSSELQFELESLSGMRISNPKQAKLATNMVKNMSMAADAAGIDEKAFMKIGAAVRQTRQKSLAQQYGIDGENSTQLNMAAAAQTNTMMYTVGNAMLLQTKNSEQRKLAGLDPLLGEVTADEMLVRKNKDAEWADTYQKGRTLASGNLSAFYRPEKIKEIEAVMAQQSAAKKESSKKIYDNQLIDLLKADGESRESFLMGDKAKILLAGGKQGASGVALQDAIDQQSYDNASLADVRQTAGGGGAGAYNTNLLHKGIGQTAATAVFAMSKAVGDDNAPEKDLRSNMKKHMLSRNITEENAEAWLTANYKADGTAVDTGMQERMLTTHRVATKGMDMSAPGVLNRATDNLDQLGKGNMSSKIKTSEGQSLMSSVINSFTSDNGIKSLKGNEGMFTKLRLAQDDGFIDLPKEITDGYTAGLNIREGLDTEKLARIDKVSGYSMSERLNYESDEAFIADSKSSAVQEKIIQEFKGNENLIGSYGNGGRDIDLITQDSSEAAQSDANLAMVGDLALTAAFEGRDYNEYTQLSKSITDGGDANFSDFRMKKEVDQDKFWEIGEDVTDYDTRFLNRGKAFSMVEKLSKMDPEARRRLIGKDKKGIIMKSLAGEQKKLETELKADEAAGRETTVGYREGGRRDGDYKKADMEEMIKGIQEMRDSLESDGGYTHVKVMKVDRIEPGDY